MASGVDQVAASEVAHVALEAAQVAPEAAQVASEAAQTAMMFMKKDALFKCMFQCLVIEKKQQKNLRPF